jgi:hypothetical protein
MARRFTQSYMDHPPGGYDHQVCVLINGLNGPAIRKLFEPLPCQYLEHNNDAKDLGAYFRAARQLECDLMLCLGSPVRFRKAGWLDQIVNLYLACGPGLYGSWGCHQPKPHIRTTGFFCPPELLNNYPFAVTNSTRYQVEHGADSLTLWCQKMGFVTYQVTWKGAFAMEHWHTPSNEDCLFLDQNGDRMGYK